MPSSLVVFPSPSWKLHYAASAMKQMRVLVADASVDKFSNFDKDKRQKFFRTSHDLMGAQLVAKIEQVVEEDSVSTIKMKLTGTGDWMDSPELAKKYKDKPQQLAAVRKNCRKWQDDQREVKLYEDMKYASENPQEDEHTLRKKLKVRTEGTQAKAKPKAAEKKVTTKEPVAKTFSGTELEGLAQFKKELDDSAAATSTLSDEFSEFADYLPVFLNKTVATIIAKTNETNALVALVIESREGNFAQVKEQVAAAKKDISSVTKMAKGHLKVTKGQKSAIEDTLGS